MKGAAILIEASPGEVRGALIRNGAVWDVVHHRISQPSLMGASYRGRIRHVDAGINGAFVDIGTGQDAFLRARDASLPGEQKARRARIAEMIHEGAQIDVQVVADGFAGKGPPRGPYRGCRAWIERTRSRRSGGAGRSGLAYSRTLLQ